MQNDQRYNSQRLMVNASFVSTVSSAIININIKTIEDGETVMPDFVMLYGRHNDHKNRLDQPVVCQCKQCH